MPVSKSISFFYTAVLICSLISCNDKKEVSTFSVSSDEITFDIEGGTQEISVNSNSGWNISHGDADWLTITPESGRIIIRALSNKTPDEKVSNIVVTVAGENVNQNIDIRQSGVKGKIPVSTSANGKQLWSWTYDEQNRLTRQELNGTVCLSYNASGDIQRVVKIDMIWFYETDSIVYGYQKNGKTVTCNIQEYKGKEVKSSYSETMTLNSNDLPGRIDCPEKSRYHTFTYDGAGNVLSYKTFGMTGNLQDEETFTYDHKKGFLSDINTSKWWFIRDNMNFISNNILTDQGHSLFTYTYTYDACGYPETIHADGSLNIEYKSF